MNTGLVLYGHPNRTKQYTKTRTQTCSESRDVGENDIDQWLGETFGIYCQLATEWRRIAFVYDLIGNMTEATSVDARGDSNDCKRRVLRSKIEAPRDVRNSKGP